MSAADRLAVQKTWKMYVGGGFPRSESGRTDAVRDRRGRPLAHVCRASRKDVRDAVSAARAAQPGWAGRDAYNRGQILYRLAEMIEGKGEEFAAAIAATAEGGLRRARKEVTAAADRLVCFAGWADKYSQVLGCHNPVAGPFYDFTIPEPTGVIGVVAPEEQPLLGLVSLAAPPLCAGDTVVALASHAHPLAAVLLGEACATADVPPGVVNLLTGRRDELAAVFAAHRGVDGIHAAGCGRALRRTLELGAAENLKRVRVRDVRGDGWYDEDACHGPEWIEPFVEMKTIWHPSAT